MRSSYHKCKSAWPHPQRLGGQAPCAEPGLQAAGASAASALGAREARAGRPAARGVGVQAPGAVRQGKGGRSSAGFLDWGMRDGEWGNLGIALFFSKLGFLYLTAIGPLDFHFLVEIKRFSTKPQKVKLSGWLEGSQGAKGTWGNLNLP